MATAKICPSCNGSGGEYREVRENSTGTWTKKFFKCSRCNGKGKVS